MELELKAVKDNAGVRVKSVEDYQAIVDAEWNILYDKLGAKVVLSKLPIGDVATQFFADWDLFCADRVQEDLKRTMMTCGCSIQTSVGSLTDDVLGQCTLFEDIPVGGERYNFFKGCPKAKTCTIILRGGAEQFIEETERLLHDAIMIVRRAIKNDSVVAGGGAIEMALAAQGGMWYGADVNNKDIADNYEACVWEPSRVNTLTAASEATCLILPVDETIKNPRSAMDGPPGGQGRDHGRPHAH
ncbi:TCPH protein, partial [Polyodon spathula]|nr:TCPH protein [Polyodon spathula]